MKYRLIKEYPGSPKLGTIVEDKNGSLYFPETNSVESSSKGNLFKEIVINNPEFWEEVVEKDYEILSYYSIDGRAIYDLQPNGKYLIKNGRNEYHPNDFKNCPIHSVKRISDGEIFTIGDKVNNSTIINIFIKKDKIYLEI